MKTNLLATTSATVLAYCALVPTSALADDGSSTIPAKPSGELSATPEVVLSGMKPFLTWEIEFPKKVYGSDGGGSGGTASGTDGGTGGTGETGETDGGTGGTGETDGGTIGSNGTGGIVAAQTDSTTIHVNDNLYVSVTPIGTGVTTGDPGLDSNEISAEARISVNGGSSQQLFFGNQSDVDSAHLLYAKQLNAGTTIDFGGRYVRPDAYVWSSFYTTTSSNMQVVTLKNGDAPPTSFSFAGYPKLKSYLKPYFDGSGQVKLGPMSVLVMMELGQTDHSHSCFDYQDMVLLVTFSKKHPNNGHGNNLDGVDSSNPGQGSGGPNGQLDPSGGYDDEMR